MKNSTVDLRSVLNVNLSREEIDKLATDIDPEPSQKHLPPLKKNGLLEAAEYLN